MLPLLIDENLNHRILRGLLRLAPHLNFRLASESGLAGSNDPAVLERAAKEGWILLTHDLRTIPKYAYERLKAGQPMSGVIAVPHDLSIGRAIDDVLIAIECTTPAEMQSVVLYLPL